MRHKSFTWKQGYATISIIVYVTDSTVSICEHDGCSFNLSSVPLDIWKAINDFVSLS